MNNNNKQKLHTIISITLKDSKNPNNTNRIILTIIKRIKELKRIKKLITKKHKIFLVFINTIPITKKSNYIISK